MFGFEPSQRDLTASSSSATFDLNLQTHATLAVEPAAEPKAPTDAGGNCSGCSGNAPRKLRRARRGPGRGGPAAGLCADPVAEESRDWAEFQLRQGGGAGRWRQCCRDAQRPRRWPRIPEPEPDPEWRQRARCGDISPSLNGARRGYQPAPTGLHGERKSEPGRAGPGGRQLRLGRSGRFQSNTMDLEIRRTTRLAPRMATVMATSQAVVGGRRRRRWLRRRWWPWRRWRQAAVAALAAVAAVAVAAAATRPNRNLQFGNRINRGRGISFRATSYYTIGNSVLNARPYSFTSPTTLTGAELPKAGYASNRFGFSGGGPLVDSAPLQRRQDLLVRELHRRPVEDRLRRRHYRPDAGGEGRRFLRSDLRPTRRSPSTMPVTTTPFADNMIPTSLLNPAALALLTLHSAAECAGIEKQLPVDRRQSDRTTTTCRRASTRPSPPKTAWTSISTISTANSETIQPFGFADPTSGYGLSTLADIPAHHQPNV